MPVPLGLYLQPMPQGLAIPWGLLDPKGPPQMLDLWLSDVVPGPPDGAPQVVAVTGRMITLAWNPPRSLDMAIGGFGPHWAMGGEGAHGQDRLRQGTRGARRGRQGPGGHTGRSGDGWSIGNRTEVGLRPPLPTADRALALGQGRRQRGVCHVAFSSQKDWVPGLWFFPLHSFLLHCASVCLPWVVARN